MNASITLPSNGFGRFEQQIVFSIQEGQRKSLPDDLDIVPLTNHSSPPRVSYLWRRWSARWGDDEDIVFELWAILGTAEDSPDWQIDWKASVY
jgi:hypothetical protein